MKWEPTETAPDDEQVLVAYLEPFFGKYTTEIGTGYYDSESGKWRFHIPDKEIVGGGVTHWMPLPEPPETES